MLRFDIRGCWNRAFCDTSRTGCLSLPTSEYAPFGTDISAQHHKQHSVALYSNMLSVQLPPFKGGNPDLPNKGMILPILLNCICDTQEDAFLPLLLHEK